MDLTLYRVVGTQNRVALGDLARGVEFYSVEKTDDGLITLTPVTIREGGPKRTGLDDEDQQQG